MPASAVGPVTPEAPLVRPTTGDLLHWLIAHGDGWFVKEIHAMAEYRIAWILERDSLRCVADVPPR